MYIFKYISTFPLKKMSGKGSILSNKKFTKDEAKIWGTTLAVVLGRFEKYEELKDWI